MKIWGHRSLFYSKYPLYLAKVRNFFKKLLKILENIATLMHLKLFCQK